MAYLLTVLVFLASDLLFLWLGYRIGRLELVEEHRKKKK